MRAQSIGDLSTPCPPIFSESVPHNAGNEPRHRKEENLSAKQADCALRRENGRPIAPPAPIEQSCGSPGVGMTPRLPKTSNRSRARGPNETRKVQEFQAAAPIKSFDRR